LIIRLIIQTILLYPSGAVQVDAEHPSRNRKVIGSNPTSGSTNRRSAGDAAYQLDELLRVADEPSVPTGQLEEVSPGPSASHAAAAPIQVSRFCAPATTVSATPLACMPCGSLRNMPRRS
jgi:hypothetical protein